MGSSLSGCHLWQHMRCMQSFCSMPDHRLHMWTICALVQLFSESSAGGSRPVKDRCRKHATASHSRAAHPRYGKILLAQLEGCDSRGRPPLQTLHFISFCPEQGVHSMLSFFCTCWSYLSSY